MKRTTFFAVCLVLSILVGLPAFATQETSQDASFWLEAELLEDSAETTELPAPGLVPYDMAQQHKYMDYTVETDPDLVIFVCTGDQNRTVLPDALAQGIVTPEQLLAQLEQDARIGVCRQEINGGRNRVSTFVYRYDDYAAGVTNALYVNARQESYLVRKIQFRRPDASFQNYPMTAMDQELPDAVDRPDWGVTLEVVEADSAGMQLRCCQDGSTPDGTLYLGDISSIARKTDQGWDFQAAKSWSDLPTAAIQAGGETTLWVDWSTRYGSLEPGVYNIRLWIVLESPDGTRTPSIFKVTVTVPEAK